MKVLFANNDNVSEAIGNKISKEYKRNIILQKCILFNAILRELQKIKVIVEL